jgi:hypothetical protein
MFLTEKFGKKSLLLLTLKGVPMNRRKFISFSLISLTSLPLLALENKPTEWRKDTREPKAINGIQKVSDAITVEYEDQKIIKESKDISLKVSKDGLCPESFPIQIRSDLDIKKITMFISTTSTILLGIVDVPKDSIIDYRFRGSTYKNGYLVILSETHDNNIYENSAWLEVAGAGGCG